MTKKTNNTTETTQEPAKTVKRKPTHAIYHVIGDKDQGRWTKIGAAWPNKDGSLRLLFDAFPVTGRTMLREISEQSDAVQESK
jgi:hypothetical protein